MDGRLLDRIEAAERLHVSEMTVRRLGKAGHLTEVREGCAQSASLRRA